MAGAIKRVSGPAAMATSATTVYTVPTGMRAIVRLIHIQNPGGGAAYTFNMSIGADATGTRIFNTISIAAGSYFTHYGPFTAEAAEIIQAFASNAALVLTLEVELVAV